MTQEIKEDKAWEEFEAEDYFNNNQLSGYICRKPNDDYGALYIEKVNDVMSPQLILCTPKMHYPFNKNNEWTMPRAKRVERYEKLDGTNIFAYSYKDSEGRNYVTYKTRLTPVIKSNRHGDFENMWKDMLSKYPFIPSIVQDLNINLSFELWGARNRILINHDVPLEASLLFARKNGKIIPPSEINIKEDIPQPYLIEYFGSSPDDEYHKAQNNMQDKFKETDDGIEGQEGEIWYVLLDTGEWKQFKCKPASIMDIHFAASGIGKHSIIATCQNAYENWEDPTVDNIKQLLLEEYPESDIANAHDRIVGYLSDVKQEMHFRARVLDDYNDLGLNILADKANVMRALSPKYQPQQMKRVYSVIWSSVAQ